MTDPDEVHQDQHQADAALIGTYHQLDECLIETDDDAEHDEPGHDQPQQQQHMRFGEQEIPALLHG